MYQLYLCFQKKLTPSGNVWYRTCNEKVNYKIIYSENMCMLYDIGICFKIICGGINYMWHRWNKMGHALIIMKTGDGNIDVLYTIIFIFMFV